MTTGTVKSITDHAYARFILVGVFFAQWRAQRSGALHGQLPRMRRQVYEAMYKRLRAAILKDWARRRGRDKFVRRWRPLRIVTEASAKLIRRQSTSSGFSH